MLGHENCGAVGAALKYVQDGKTQPGHIQELVNAIAPAVTATRDAAGDWHENAIARNVELSVKAMTDGSQIVSDAVARGDAQVIGGIYSVRTGLVTFS